MADEKDDELDKGLVAYFSSQANVMLGQYNSINWLLGRTNDWSAPGDFCEVLLRDTLRKFLPSYLSADKGFFYGRTTTTANDKEWHSPEIDILIHDSSKYTPLFRMGHFVIVDPRSVRGMIQVKRTLKPGTLCCAIQNIMIARQHLDNLAEKALKEKQEDWFHVNPFTAVIGFKDEIGKNYLKVYKKRLSSNLTSSTALDEIKHLGLSSFV